MMNFNVGDRVRHCGRDELGTVTAVDADGVHVTYDNPTPKGKPSRGLYDERWFELLPGMLVRADSGERP